jgi:hypothetical protein
MIPTHYKATWTENGRPMARIIVKRSEARLFRASMLLRGIRVNLKPEGFAR